MKKPLTRPQTTKFQSLIWTHYHTHGRSMPWRGEKSPYKVLVSEIMLQQTQVSRVTEKYREFLKRFPVIQSLANAKLSEVIIVWQGLGYNRRARFLHEFAKEVVAKHKGKIPSDYDQLLSLPGIGKGTAGSLSAFAFNLPVVFIETNIRRVYIHQFFPKKETVSDSELLPLIEQTLDTSNPREWYYALMDYGVYLKSQVPNPNVRSKHYVKQSKFDGSNREVRGAIVRFLTKQTKVGKISLHKALGFELPRFETALSGLMEEGLVIQNKGDILLA